MQVAQKLYEGLDIGGEVAGLITYMRTDGVQMAPEAIDAARRAIGQQFGDRYLPEKPRFYSTKAKNAQEAHEAIRPTDFNRTPDSVRRYLDADQFKLYDLIWKRGIASQMASADIERTTVEISATNGDRKAGFRAVGSVIKFDGFIAAYTDQREELEDQASGDEEDGRLPEIRAQETLAREKINASQHFTEPPPRYTEATLIKKMEELGIGRPSTYASTLATLRDRGYVTIDKRKLIPDSKGRIVTAFLEHFFTRYVEYDFTASLEEKLDSISAGDLNWKDVLRDFWKDFFAQIEQTKELKVSDIIDAMNDALAPLLFPPRADGGDPRVCQVCGTGRLSLKLGRYGAFIGCSNYPDCNFTRQLSSEAADEGSVSNEPVSFGTDPLTGEEVTLRSGRFGPYVQRGDGKTAKRASLPKGWRPDMMDLEKALALLNLPRDIGAHPETGKMISAGIGRYGPFVLHDGVYANLESVEDVFSIGLNRAVAVLADKASKSAGGGRSARAAASALKELGDHPDGGKVTVRDGRYGPYVNWGKVNATLPKGKDPQSVTFEEALALIAERAAKSPVKSKSTAKKKSAAADTGETKTKAASKPKAAAKSKAGAKTKKA
jgi:DNA topoisomerase-1